MPADRSKRQNQGSSKQQSPNQGSSQEQPSNRPEEERDLKEREYRDSQGNVHHHTNKYMEQHKGKGKSQE